MLTAIISDIHGNLAALQAVLADMRTYKPDRIICLGDTVGYGPQPNECLKIVREVCSIVLMGNHENAVIHGAEHFTPLARMAIEWTAEQLNDPETIRYLNSLKPMKQIDDALFVHGSARDPLFEYVREADSPWMFHRLIQSLHEDFKGFHVCFVGHNHRAFLGTELGYIFPHDDPPAPRMEFNIREQNLYVSIGSVGQPRDGDPRSSYVLFDGDSVRYRRVAYDPTPTIELIRKFGLPGFLADRLIHGE